MYKLLFEILIRTNVREEVFRLTKKIVFTLFLVGVLSICSFAEEYWQKDWVWQEINDGYKVTEMVFGNLATGNYTYTNYVLDFDVVFHEFSQWGNLRVMLRQNGQWDCYCLTIVKDGMELWRLDGRWDMGVLLGGYYQKTTTDVKHHLQAVVQDNQINIYWDGNLVIKAKDSKNRFISGGVVLRTEMATMEIYNPQLSKVQKVDPKVAREEIWQRAPILNPLPENPHPFQSPEEVGFRDMMLIYNGYYGNGAGEWSYFDALPYVAYLAEDFSLQDRMFDAFLFLGTYSPAGRSFDSARGQPDLAATKDDWLWYLDRLFTEDMQINAFNRACGKINDVLGESKPAQAVIMIPTPDPEQDNFGEINGERLSFSPKNQSASVTQENRLKAIIWYLDEIEKRWQANDITNLSLLGFYWLKEEIDTPEDAALVRQVADLLHQRGYKFYWIPYFKSPGYDSEYGFDCVFTQPNYMFTEQVSLARFWDMYVDAKKFGMNVEIEGEDTIINNPAARERYLTYLKAAVTLDFENIAKAYYFGTKALANCALDGDPNLRNVYDQTYRFIKGQYQEGLFD